MIIGFTGTRSGMNSYQKKALTLILQKHRFDDMKKLNEFHHGDCVGSDEEAHEIAHNLGYWIVTHPPTNTRLRAFQISHCEKPPLGYLERNHNIVDACSLLIAAPLGPELQRSGTWATIRYARKTGKSVTVLERG
jgi:hypothetical protein